MSKRGRRYQPRFEDLTADEWFQAYRIIHSRTAWIDREMVYDALQAIVADRMVGEMVCHQGTVWTI